MVVTGGRPGEPEPSKRPRRPVDDGLDDLFADIGTPRPAGPAREPAGGLGWDVLPAANEPPAG